MLEVNVMKEYFSCPFSSCTMIVVVTLELSMYYLFVQRNTNGEQHWLDKLTEVKDIL